MTRRREDWSFLSVFGLTFALAAVLGLLLELALVGLSLLAIWDALASAVTVALVVGIVWAIASHGRNGSGRRRGT